MVISYLIITNRERQGWVVFFFLWLVTSHTATLEGVASPYMYVYTSLGPRLSIYGKKSRTESLGLRLRVYSTLHLYYRIYSLEYQRY